jgi:hypothetical protein
MKASKFTEAQKAFILKQGEAVRGSLSSEPDLGRRRDRRVARSGGPFSLAGFREKAATGAAKAGILQHET